MESIAYQELALTWEAATGLESFELVDWKKLSAQGFIRFLCLCVTLSVLTIAEASLAQGLTGFPVVQGQTFSGGTTIPLPPKGFFERGDRSFAVAAVQQLLQNQGYFQTTPTGFYGPITEDAVRRFQGDRRITANGLVGPTTLSYLLGLVPTTQFSTTQFPTTQFPTTPSPIPPLPASNAILSFGDFSPEVGRVQQRLKDLGYYFGFVNNFFDANTQQAVIRFQQERNITPTGRVGPTTSAFLFSSPGPSPLPPSPGALPVGLAPGARGLPVRVLQGFLNRLGYGAGSVDGVFGSTTQLAVTRLQQDLGVIPTGAIGEDTLFALRNYLNLTQLGSTQNYLGVSSVGSTQNYPRVAQQGYRVSGTFANDRSRILQLQRRLNLQGLYSGPFDGIYNSQMQQAIARARQLYGISAADILFQP
ncbi:MAG: peptidoglycan-binding protein [Cyanobacteriota bacterium]|nr:peptidoglycan-binding protein [Cyanobacteriota bacterium]